VTQNKEEDNHTEHHKQG